MKLSIIIPAYNEEEFIGKTLDEFTNNFDKLKKDYEILVVINNTTDNTEAIVKEKQKKNKRIRYLNLKPGGKGFALIQGFKDAIKRKKDLIGFVDADLATRPEEFAKLLPPLEKKQADAAIASRCIKGSKIVPAFTFRRTLTSRVFNFLVRSFFLIPHRDTQCGAKIFTRAAIEHFLPRLSITNWAMDVDILYKLRKQGYRIKDVPNTWYDIEGQGRLKVTKAAPQMLFAIIQLRILESPFRRLLIPLRGIISPLWRLLNR
jgi:glycosyltransferase involved in cell wall biosynthesis